MLVWDFFGQKQKTQNKNIFGEMLRTIGRGKVPSYLYTSTQPQKLPYFPKSQITSQYP